MSFPFNRLLGQDDDSAFDMPEPLEDGLGEFAETIIDQDGELDPDVLEEPDANEVDSGSNVFVSI